MKSPAGPSIGCVRTTRNGTGFAIPGVFSVSLVQEAVRCRTVSSRRIGRRGAIFGRPARALDVIVPDDGSLVVIENVGNSVCWARFDLRERADRKPRQAGEVSAHVRCVGFTTRE